MAWFPVLPPFPSNSGPSVSIDEIGRLRREADAKTVAIGKLIASGKLPTDEETIKTLRRLVDELDDIRKRLDALERRPAAPSASTTSPRTSGFMQFNERSSNQVGAPLNDGFQERRAWLFFDANPDPRTAARFSFDIAAGANQQQFQLKDAWVTYRISPAGALNESFRVGQQGLPLGIELVQSNIDREFPERAMYNRALFLGERARGVLYTKNLNALSWYTVGLVDSLTTEEAEQLNVTSGAGGRLAGFANVRSKSTLWDAGVSALAGERPAYTAGGVTSKAADRRFLVADAEYAVRAGSKLKVRGEVLYGQDRLPNVVANAAASVAKMNAFQFQVKYALDPMNDVNFRWEAFQPNADAPGSYMRGYGFSYRHFLTKDYLVMLAYDSFVDESRGAIGQTAFEIATLRFQIRF